MAHKQKCGRLNGHDSHEWTQLVRVPDRLGEMRDRVVNQTNWCEGVAHDRSAEGLTERLAVVEYRNLTSLSFELETRERIPTKFEFSDLVVGDSHVTVTVVEGDDRWAMVDIRLLARKPFTVTEVHDDERLF